MASRIRGCVENELRGERDDFARRSRKAYPFDKLRAGSHGAVSSCEAEPRISCCALHPGLRSVAPPGLLRNSFRTGVGYLDKKQGFLRVEPEFVLASSPYRVLV